MTLVAHSAFETATPQDIAERCLTAARLSWEVEASEVILLGHEAPDARALRSVLQAMGLDVQLGISGYAAQPDVPPLLLVTARHWRTPALQASLPALRRTWPEAVLCVVTGFLPRLATLSSDTPAFPDARAVLRAAGLGFFSVEGLSDEHSA